MAAVIYSGRAKTHNQSAEQAQAAAVADAWRLWHLAMDHGADPSHPFRDSELHPQAIRSRIHNQRGERRRADPDRGRLATRATDVRLGISALAARTHDGEQWPGGARAAR